MGLWKKGVDRKGLILHQQDFINSIKQKAAFIFSTNYQGSFWGWGWGGRQSEFKICVPQVKMVHNIFLRSKGKTNLKVKTHTKLVYQGKRFWS